MMDALEVEREREKFFAEQARGIVEVLTRPCRPDTSVFLEGLNEDFAAAQRDETAWLDEQELRKSWETTIGDGLPLED